ncbi:hypothetical protein QR680_004921 [Steinernema hermaphroditum]|uniref:Uncharacterized protein n=1 Tax=Steinernema hermaphroditum TaxID=289476 RepID=A0AA39LUG5_9BILA|nr:hypothetical protein QR680_004921 [Steinernema hermaphroditum]
MTDPPKASSSSSDGSVAAEDAKEVDNAVGVLVLEYLRRKCPKTARAFKEEVDFLKTREKNGIHSALQGMTLERVVSAHFGSATLLQNYARQLQNLSCELLAKSSAFSLLDPLEAPATSKRHEEPSGREESSELLPDQFEEVNCEDTFHKAEETASAKIALKAKRSPKKTERVERTVEALPSEKDAAAGDLLEELMAYEQNLRAIEKERLKKKKHEERLGKEKKAKKNREHRSSSKRRPREETREEREERERKEEEERRKKAENKRLTVDYQYRLCANFPALRAESADNYMHLLERTQRNYRPKPLEEKAEIGSVTPESSRESSPNPEERTPERKVEIPSVKFEPATPSASSSPLASFPRKGLSTKKRPRVEEPKKTRAAPGMAEQNAALAFLLPAQTLRNNFSIPKKRNASNQASVQNSPMCLEEGRGDAGPSGLQNGKKEGRRGPCTPPPRSVGTMKKRDLEKSGLEEVYENISPEYLEMVTSSKDEDGTPTPQSTSESSSVQTPLMDTPAKRVCFRKVGDTDLFKRLQAEALASENGFDSPAFSSPPFEDANHPLSPQHTSLSARKKKKSRWDTDFGSIERHTVDSRSPQERGPRHFLESDERKSIVKKLHGTFEKTILDPVD